MTENLEFRINPYESPREESVIRGENEIDEIPSLNRFEKVTWLGSFTGFPAIAIDIYNSLIK